MIETLFLILIGAGVILCFLRMLLGPTAADRAIAVDTVTTVITALLVLLGFIFKRYVYLDVSLIYSILSFAGLVAIARYLERGF
jgi:multicomponent Na+:H+ antiporter subunit F